ncbi:MAG: hypothetical protein VR70_12535, partial [Rhodospirillaceae bacterium BRH_c57]
GPAGLAVAAGIGAVGLAFGAASARARVALTEMDAIAKVADSIGLTTTALQEMRFAAGLAGGSTQELDASLKGFAQRLGQARTGTGEMAEQLKKIDAGLLATVTAAGSTEEGMNSLLKVIAETPDAADRLSLATAAFGEGAAFMTEMVEGGTVALEANRQKARELGLVYDEHLLRSAEETNDKLSIQAQIIDVQLNRAVVALGPDLVRISTLMADFSVAGARVLDSFRDVEDMGVQALSDRLNILKSNMDGIQKARDSTFWQSSKDRMDAQLRELMAEYNDVLGRLLELQNKPVAPPRPQGDDDAAMIARRTALLKEMATAEEEARQEYTKRLTEISELEAAGKLNTQESAELRARAAADLAKVVDKETKVRKDAKSQLDAYLTGLDQESVLMGLSTDAREVQRALLDAESKARADVEAGLRTSVELTAEEVAQIERAIAVRQRHVVADRQAVEAQRAADKAATEAQRERERAAETAAREGERKVDAIVQYGADRLVDGIMDPTRKGWKDMLGGMMKDLSAFFMRAAAEAALRPIAVKMVGVMTEQQGVSGDGKFFGAAQSASGNGSINSINSLSLPPGTGEKIWDSMFGGGAASTAGWASAGAASGNLFGGGAATVGGATLGSGAGVLGNAAASYGSAWGASTASTGSLFAGSAASGTGSGALSGAGGAGIGGALPYIGLALQLGAAFASGDVKQMVGTGGGMAAGAAIGSVIPGIGTLIGAAIGGMLGSMGASFLGSVPAGDNVVAINSSGAHRVEVGDEEGQSGDKLLAMGAAMLDGLRDAGTSFRGTLRSDTHIASLGYTEKYDEWWVEDKKMGSAEEAAEAALTKGLTNPDLWEGISDNIATAMRASVGKGAEEALSNITFAAGWDNLLGTIEALNEAIAPEPIGQYAAALEGITAQVDAQKAATEQAAERARALGLSLNDVAAVMEALDAAGAKAAGRLRDEFNKEIGDQILSMTDPTALALRNLGDSFKGLHREAVAVGGDIGQLNRLYALQRAELEAQRMATLEADVTRAYEAESRARQDLRDGAYGLAQSMRDLRQSLLLDTNLSPLSAPERLAEAKRQYDETLAASRLGDLQAGQRLTQIGPQYLEALKAVNSTASAEYKAGFDGVQSDLRDVETVAERHVRIADEQLGVMRGQMEALGLINTSVLSLADALAAYQAAAIPASGGGPSAPVTSFDALQGQNAGGSASIEERAAAYLAANPDVAAHYGAGNLAGALQHFNQYGQFEGRSFSSGGTTRPGEVVRVHNEELLYTGPTTHVFNRHEARDILSGGSNRTDMRGVEARLDRVAGALERLIGLSARAGEGTLDRLDRVADAAEAQAQAAAQQRAAAA